MLQYGGDREYNWKSLLSFEDVRLISHGEKKVLIENGGNMSKQKHYKITGSCIGCKNCYRVCPVQAISIGPMKINDDKCVGCGKCLEACPGRKIIEITNEVKYN